MEGEECVSEWEQGGAPGNPANSGGGGGSGGFFSNWTPWDLARIPVTAFGWKYGTVDRQAYAYAGKLPSEATSVTMNYLGWYWGKITLGTGIDFGFMDLNLPFRCEDCYASDVVLAKVNERTISVNPPTPVIISVPKPIDPGVQRAQCLIDSLNANNGLGLPSSGPYSGESVAMGTQLWQNTSKGWQVVNTQSLGVQQTAAGLNLFASPGFQFQVSYSQCRP